ncbi:MAG: DNA-3-methyladenine glycosylase I [Flavobacteriaceae bacterium]|nr:DNA-3-methyladenine glycosylase I [Flavobacteriaceae bacterium]
MGDSKVRCPWCLGDRLYEQYHDCQWGVPIFDDRLIFEMLTLETFQAGLSWITVLKRRENFRYAMDNFDYEKIALYSPKKVEQLLSNKTIIRNRLKITSLITNAKAFIETRKSYGSFSEYLWAYVDNKPIVNYHQRMSDIPVFTDLSVEISKDLKSKGFRFVGPTIIYSKMQAMGMINDHLVSCFRHNELSG